MNLDASVIRTPSDGHGDQRTRENQIRDEKTHFPTTTEGLPEATPTATLDLEDGAKIALRITPLTKKIAGATVRMLGYNGSVPGPTLRVRQGTELIVDVANEGDLDATVHWHGLRLDNRFDGTRATQAPMPVGGSFTYRLSFPDPGVYWYHPHIRDYGQEMGLYANIIVVPTDPDYWPVAHREMTVTLDDILIEDGDVASFSRSKPNYVAMGRFGNVFLINGEESFSLAARRGEVVRFYLTNTANTRVFNVAFRGAQMKLVGGDSGRVEREEFVDGVVIAPSERVVVDVLFSEHGPVALEHRTPKRTYALGAITVSDETAQPDLASTFAQLRVNADLVAARRLAEPYFDAPPDRTISFVAEMDLGLPDPEAGEVVAYVCPMHPEVVSDAPGKCPKCHMKLIARAEGEPAQAHGHHGGARSHAPAHHGGEAKNEYACPMHPEVVSGAPGECPKCHMKLVPRARGKQKQELEQHHGHSHADTPTTTNDGGIEWEDDMVEVNAKTTTANTRWKLVSETNWSFRVGDLVKIRLVNEMDSDHPMHHPFHIHGAGRFLVLSRDGAPETNLVWKDSVLVRTGQTVDLLLEVTNPGRWMAHCHIAEHHEGGMMLSFDVQA